MYNITDKYIIITKKYITKYLKLVFERKFSKKICDEYIKTYINVRYYNLYEKGNYYTLRKEILLNIKEKKERMIVDNYANEDLIENMAVFFFYIVYFDKVTPYKNLDKIINNITTLRKKILNKENEDFRQNLFDLVQDDSKEKEQLLSKFESNEFFLKISNYENTSNVYRVNLKYNIEFPEIYSTIAIEKAFNMTTVSEDKLFVEYYMISVKILNDILKGNFKKQYILEFSDTLLKKKQKMNRLMKIINNLAIQDKISLKIRYEQFNKNKEQIYELMRNGFKIAVILDSTVNTERTEIERLNIFSYILINKDASYYDDIMKNKKILRNVIEI